jgi:OFA family oxalate/formate antiporter-like MFS transporter
VTKLGYGVGGILFPILGGFLGDMGNFSLAFTICGVACLFGAALVALLFPPHHEDLHEPFSVHGFFHHAHVFDHDPADDLFAQQKS